MDVDFGVGGRYSLRLCHPMKQSSTSTSVTPHGFTRSAWMTARSHFGPDGDETRLPLFHVQRRIVLFLFADVGISPS